MKRAAVMAVLIATAVACSTSGSSGSTSDGKGPEGMDLSSWHAVCRALVDLQSTFEGVSKQTITDSEAVSQLASAQTELDGDASAAAVDSADMQAKIQAVADATGHVKVALDSGDDTAASTAEFGDALKALPAC